MAYRPRESPVPGFLGTPWPALYSLFISNAKAGIGPFFATLYMVGTMLGWLTNQHSQYFLIFLPLLSVVAAYGVIAIAELFRAPRQMTGIALSTTLAIIAAAGLLAYAASNTPFSESFIEDLERNKVRYVIGVENWMTEGLSPEALNYIRNNFDCTPCLWTRRVS